MAWIANVTKIIPLVIAAVGLVEKLAGAAKGKEKQDAALAAVADLIPAIEGAIGRDVVNDPLVQAALRQCIDAVVAVQNAVRDANAKR